MFNVKYVVKADGAAAALRVTNSVTGEHGERLCLVHLHAPDGSLMPGYEQPLFEPLSLPDARRHADGWAERNGWRRP
ncbi:MAG: hypothetical protein INR65_02345 [Gluconacetobacter diazotrophicus]|nr:hypothetical protein [Gluconacetobacter diazotrophicus]